MQLCFFEYFSERLFPWLLLLYVDTRGRSQTTGGGDVVVLSDGKVLMQGISFTHSLISTDTMFLSQAVI